MRGWGTGVDPEPPDAAERAPPADWDCVEPPAPDDWPDDEVDVIGERRARADRGRATKMLGVWLGRRKTGALRVGDAPARRANSDALPTTYALTQHPPPPQQQQRRSAPRQTSCVEHPDSASTSSDGQLLAVHGRLLRGTCRLSSAPQRAHGRDGLSFYSHRRMSAALEMSPDTYQQARHGMLRRDLIAADGVRVQVLSLPPEPVRLQPRPMPRRDQASACQAILAALTAHAPKSVVCVSPSLRQSPYSPPSPLTPRSRSSPEVVRRTSPQRDGYA
jgi:hypothetical protein